MMKKNILFLLSVFATAVIIIISSCKKDVYVNPYDDPALDAPNENPNPDNLSSDNFAYLHYKVFKPTCANSGCHDGTFAPDFRTINSSYNTLVYQKPVKEDIDGHIYQYRVWPGDADESVLYKRLTFHRDTFAEQMPLYINRIPPVYSFPYWKGYETPYINAIKKWINDGAKDMFGNSPSIGNMQPQITGLLAFPAGNISSAFSRTGETYPPIDVTSGNSSIDVWFLMEDDSTLPANLTDLGCTVSVKMDDTTGAKRYTASYIAPGSAVNGPDFANTNRTFTHKVNISLVYPQDTTVYLRVNVNDNSQGSPTVIPNTGSGAIMKSYFAFKVKL